MAEKSKSDFTNEEKQEALDFNSIEDVQFKELVVEAGNDKNAENGAATLPTSRYDDQGIRVAEPPYFCRSRLACVFLACVFLACVFLACVCVPIHCTVSANIPVRHRDSTNFERKHF